MVGPLARDLARLVSAVLRVERDPATLDRVDAGRAIAPAATCRYPRGPRAPWHDPQVGCLSAKVGFANWSVRARWAPSASSGRRHWWSWISLPSTRIVSGFEAAAKNQVANRIGLEVGVVHWQIGCRLSGSTRTPASSSASRPAARRAASSSSVSCPGRWSPGSTRPPGKTQYPPMNLRSGLRSRYKISGPASPSRSSTTDAAGCGSTMGEGV